MQITFGSITKKIDVEIPKAPGTEASRHPNNWPSNQLKLLPNTSKLFNMFSSTSRWKFSSLATWPNVLIQTSKLIFRYSWLLLTCIQLGAKTTTNKESCQRLGLRGYSRTHIARQHTPSVTAFGRPTGWRILILSQAFINLKCSVIDFLSFNCNWIWHTLNWILFACVGSISSFFFKKRRKVGRSMQGSLGSNVLDTRWNGLSGGFKVQVVSYRNFIQWNWPFGGLFTAIYFLNDMYQYTKI